MGDEVAVSTRIRWHVFSLRHEREVRRSHDGGAILVRLHDGGWVPLEDTKGIADIPPNERYKVILGTATAGDKTPKLEELAVQPFPAEGSARKLSNSWAWRDASDVGFSIGRHDRVARIDLAGTPLRPRELTSRLVPSSKWRRVVASFECDDVYGPVADAPLSALMVCRVTANRQVGLVVETDLGLIAVGVGVKRRDSGRFEFRPGDPYDRPLVVTLGAEGKPRVFFTPR